MKRIWIVVFGSVAMCFALGMLWHYSIMRDLHKTADTLNMDIKNSTVQLGIYRDTLKADGLEAARAYLETSPYKLNGN